MSKMKYREILTSSVGSGLEYYDFIIFGFFAPIFSPLFFPVDNTFLAVLWGYAAFAVGFIFRPIGGIIFGHIGDRLGRKAALSMSILFMGFGTLLIGILPTYETIGILAPLLLILARIIQGISIGGEFTGGLVFAVEHATAINRKGFAAALVLAGAMSGTLLASIVNYFISVTSWTSWRYPFILGFFISIIGLYIRRNIQETEEFIKTKSNNKIKKYPVIDGIKKYPIHIICISILIWFCGCTYIAQWIYLPTYLKVALPHINPNIIDASIAPSILVSMITVLIVGHISDRIGRAQIIKVAIFSLATFLLVMYYNLFSLTATTFILCQFIYAILNGSFASPLESYLVESITDIEVRYSSFSFANGLGTIFGGFTPLIAATLTSMNNGNILLGGFIFTVGMFALLAMYKINFLVQKINGSNLKVSYA